MKLSESKQKQLLSKEKILAFVRNFETEYEVPVSEMKDIVENGILLVRPASLDDHIQAGQLKNNSIFIARYISDCLAKKVEIDYEKFKMFGSAETMNERTYFEIDIFQRCVTAPKFSFNEVVELSRVFPTVINRVVKFVLSLTYHGAEDGDNKAS